MLSKKLISDWFRFGKRDRTGIITLLLLIILIYCLPVFFSKNREFPLKPGSVLANAVDSVGTKQQAAETERPLARPRDEPDDVARAEVFRFDPNTITAR